MIGPLAAALLAEPAVGRAVWRTKRSTIQIEKRSTNMPEYVWIVSLLPRPSCLLPYCLKSSLAR